VRWVRSGIGGAVVRGLGCAWGETNTVAMTCAFTLGAK
jgi:ABC-type phosphate transport system permease subunit